MAKSMTFPMGSQQKTALKNSNDKVSRRETTPPKIGRYKAVGSTDVLTGRRRF